MTRALAAILALAAALRLYELGQRSFWADEAATMLVLREDLGGMLSDLPDEEASPPLYYLLAWVWARVFGYGEAVTRLLPALLGVALVHVVFLIARRVLRTESAESPRFAEIAGERAALAAALVVAVSPLAVWYAQEARTYSLYALLAALTLLAALMVLERPTGRRLALWSGVSALALTAHYFAGLVVVAEAAWLVATRPTGRRAIATACALPAATAVALLPLAAAQRDHAASYLDDLSLVRRIGSVAADHVVGPQPPRLEVLGPLGVLLVAGAAAFAWRRLDLRRLALPAAIVGSVLAGLFLADLVLGNFLSPRNSLGAFAAVAVLFGAAFAATRQGLAALAALAVLSVVVVVVTADDEKVDMADWREAYGSLGEPTPRRAVRVDFTGMWPLEWYRPHARKMTSADRVSEVVLIGAPRRLHRIGTDTRPPAGPPPAAPAPFRLVEQRRERTYAIAVYRAPRPVPVPALGWDGAATIVRIDDE